MQMCAAAPKRKLAIGENVGQLASKQLFDRCSNPALLQRAWLVKQGGSASPRRVVHTGGVAAGNPRIVVRGRLGLFVVRHPGQDLRQDLPRLGKRRLAVRIVRAPHHVVPHHVVGADDVAQANADGCPPGSSRRRCGGRSRSGACRPPPSRGQAVKPLNRLAVTLADV
jgi:hypothetical protein